MDEDIEMNALECVLIRHLPRAFLVHLLFELYQLLVLLNPFEYLSHLITYLAAISFHFDFFLLKCRLYPFLLINIFNNDGLILVFVFLEAFLDTYRVVGGFLGTKLLVNDPPICYQVAMLVHLGRRMRGIEGK
jgi:hypothetical protein